jgi:hypothetical protein
VEAGLPKEIYVLLVSPLVSGSYFPILYTSILKRIKKKEKKERKNPVTCKLRPLLPQFMRRLEFMRGVVCHRVPSAFY